MSLAPIAFDFGAPAICSRAFTHSGRDYAVGEPFPYDKLELGRNHVHGMWMSAMIRFERPPGAPKATSAVLEPQEPTAAKTKRQRRALQPTQE